ncbi:MAG: M48 family metallopeptidase [Bacteroidota bacterium]
MVRFLPLGMAVVAMLGSLFVQAQPDVNAFRGFSYPDTLPAAYQLDAEQLSEELFRAFPDNLQTTYPRKLLEYADNQAYKVRNFVSGGLLYPGWDSLEVYLNDILARLLPDSLKGDPNMHVYVARIGQPNAYMTSTGHMFFTIGMFAQLPDEASIASVIAHELAHHFKRHSLKSYLASNRKLKQRTGGVLDRWYRDKHRFSIFQELQADSLGLEWLHASPFDLGGAITAFRKLKRLDVKWQRTLESHEAPPNGTHPRTDERLQLLQDFMESHPENPGKRFVVDEALFHALQQRARHEVLQVLLEDFRYHRLIETAFHYHLIDPDNPVFVYYLLEGLRREAYFHHAFWRKNFIVHRYYQKPTSKYREKEKVSGILFDQFDPEIMGMSPEEMRSVKARFYWEGDKPYFGTNMEAFVFYSKVAEKLRCSECYLTRAFAQRFSKEMRNKRLKRYLQEPNIRHRAFAERWLADSLFAALPSKTLFVFNEYTVNINQGKESITVYPDDRKNRLVLDSIFRHVVQAYDNHETMYLSDFAPHHFRDFLQFQELFNLASASWLALYPGVQPALLDPRYWDMMQRYGVNEIEFLSGRYTENRKKENTVAAYQGLKELDYASILSTSKRSRIMETYLASVRMTARGRNRVSVYSGEGKIPKNKAGFDMLKTHIRHVMNEKSNQYEARNHMRVWIGDRWVTVSLSGF